MKKGRNLPRYLVRRLESFLRVRRRRGICPEVSETDLNRLDGIVSDLVRLKYGEDGEGELPVNFIVSNRMHERLIHPNRIPRNHAAAVDALIRLLKAASDRLADEHYLAGLDEKGRTRKKDCDGK